MSGIRYLFISSDNQIYKITVPKGNEYKPMPQLADQDVLEVILYYETVSRKPSKLLFVSFDRLHLDNKGRYILTRGEIDNGIRNYILFAFQTPETISKGDNPLPIPTAVCIPTKSEKECIKNYLKELMPQLHFSGLQMIEREIKSRIDINEKNKKLVLDAAKIRKLNDRK